MQSGGIIKRKKSKFNTPISVKNTLVNVLFVMQISLSWNPEPIMIAFKPSWQFVMMILKGLQVPFIWNKMTTRYIKVTAINWNARFNNHRYLCLEQSAHVTLLLVHSHPYSAGTVHRICCMAYMWYYSALVLQCHSIYHTRYNLRTGGCPDEYRGSD